MIQYPEERYRLPDRYRGLPILLYDDETGAELCTACGACARACPLGIIHYEQAVNEEGKKLPFAETFSIEHGVCMNCGLCADNCNLGSIVMDHVLETAEIRRQDLSVTKKDLLRPVSYYKQIAPSVWAETEADAVKRLAGTMKRRPEGMGIVSRS
jgi:formate hydrogenlyase subunit 6/NADH:ubiquinone oxidoreductase subunit I